MPEMDGFTLAERIQKDRKLVDTAIILLTAPGQPRPATRLRQVACVTKPVKQSDLWDTIVLRTGTGAHEESPRSRIAAVHLAKVTGCESCWPKTTP
jgi:CheY-like chemotaxis protein